MQLPNLNTSPCPLGLNRLQTILLAFFRRFFSLPIQRVFCCSLLLALLALLASPAFCADKIAILYPDVSAPYKAIFQAILDGIKTQKGPDYQWYPLAKKYDIDQLERALESGKTAAVIALGKRGYLAAKKMNGTLPTVVGALPLIPNGISGISLSADPEQLFARLKSLVPDSKQVFVVYSPKTNGWLMPLAEAAAKKNSLKLFSFAADNLRDAMHHYRQLLKTARGRENAIWLPLDHVTAREDVVLPMLLQEVWDKDLVLCSSKPAHVQRGALFSMYPDNNGLGQELAKLAQSKIHSRNTPAVTPLKQLQIAVNTRTAAHLGLNFSQQQQQNFNLTFPSR